MDLYQLNYFHPCIKTIHIATKQKLTPVDISNIGSVLQDWTNLEELKLVGFYWQQPELMSELLTKLPNLKTLSLPSLPGLSGLEVRELQKHQPELQKLTINTSALISGSKGAPTFSHFPKLKFVRIIDNLTLTADRLAIFDRIKHLNHIEINLSNSKKDVVSGFFKKRSSLLHLKVSNCEFSDELLECLAGSCPHLQTLVWLNPKDVAGEVTDAGILAITRFKFLHKLEIKSRSVSKQHYPNLAALRNLKFARINGMKVPGCL